MRSNKERLTPRRNDAKMTGNEIGKIQGIEKGP